jgi:hypothetical protein
MNAKSQRTRILRLLIEARGAWVPLPEILALGIAQYGNRTETIDGKRHSWFRLLRTASDTPKPQAVPLAPSRPTTPETLFDLAVRP